MSLMFLFLVLFISSATAQLDCAAQQLEIYALNHTGRPGVLTTTYGVPIDEKVATNSLNTDLFRNIVFLETIQHAARERIPARMVHAKGTGAYGNLEITDDISKYCRAEVFSKVGKKIPLVVRFSLAFNDKGSPDTLRETRGLAVKLLTEKGNLDILCLSSPMFVIKDPLFFPTFAHVVQRNPATGLRDANMLLDFITLRPESIFFFLFLLSDRGIPDGYIHMAAFNIQTTQLVNKNGESYFARFHFLPDAGIKNLTTAEAAKIAGEDPDYATRGLYNAIAAGNFPSWTLYGQFLSLEQVQNAKLNPFDVTTILPENEFPLKRIGKLILNKNPDNQFAQIEQLAFNPGNLPDGFVGGPDKIFESRLFSYRDAQIYRLGVNFNNIDVNCPLHKANTYNRDGYAPVRDNGRDAPNYFPNFFGGYVPVKNKTPKLLNIYEKSEAVNFGQARDFFEKDLTANDRVRLIQNIVLYLANAVQRLQHKTIELLTKVHPGLGKGVDLALKEYQDSSIATCL